MKPLLFAFLAGINTSFAINYIPQANYKMAVLAFVLAILPAVIAVIEQRGKP